MLTCNVGCFPLGSSCSVTDDLICHFYHHIFLITKSLSFIVVPKQNTLRAVVAFVCHIVVLTKRLGYSDVVMWSY